MKRPFLTAGITVFAVSILLGIFSKDLFLCALVLLFASVGFISCVLIRKVKINPVLPFVFVFVIIACVSFYLHTSAYIEALEFCAERVSITATVKHSPSFSKEYSRHYVEASLKTINGKKVSGSIRFSFNESYEEINAKELSVGDELSFSATVYQIGTDNSMIRYFKSQGIYLGAYSLQNLTIEKPSFRPFTYYTEKLQNYISWTLSREFTNDVAGVLISLITGIKDNLSDSIYADFKNSGVAHIMAVSGLHLSILTIFLEFVLKKSRFHPVLRYIIICFSVLLMMALANFSASIKRAGIMMLVYLLGNIFSRKADALNSLGFAGCILLLVNPFCVFDVSFLLSFLCSFSILYVALPVNEYLIKKHNLDTEAKLKGTLKVILQSVIISVSTMVFTSAVTAVYFETVCLISPITNLIIIPIVPVLMITTVLFLIFGNIPVFDTLLTPIINIFSVYSIKITEIISKLSFLNLSTKSGTEKCFIVILFSVLSLICCLLAKKIRKNTANTLK